MKKVIRDDREYPIGYADTPKGKGSYIRLADIAGFEREGLVAETLQSSDIRDYITDLGELS